MADASAEKKQVVIEVFGKAAQFYDSSPFFPMCGRRLVELADIPPAAQVLDIATGTGAVLLPAAERAGPEGHVIGIDITGPMVERANAKIAEQHVRNAEVRQANAERLDFADSSFDIVLCGFGLWFIPDLDGALREMNRVLRPAGRFAASTWGPLGELARRYGDLFSSFGGTQPAHGSHSLTTPEAVEQALHSAGFQVVESLSEDVSVCYEDEEEWWLRRMACPHVNEASLNREALESFKQAAFRMVQGFRRPDGLISETRNAVYALARVP